MKSFITVLLAVGACASGIVARDAPTVLADISDIGGKVSTLGTALNNYQTFSADASGVLTAESAVETAIQKGTTDANASDSFNLDEANQILSAVKDLIPTIIGAVNAAVDKYPLFVRDAAGGILTDRLRALKSLTDSFAAALIAKAPSAATSAAQAAINCIDSAFDSALQTPPARASDCSGNIQLPVVDGGGDQTTLPPPTGPTQPGPTQPGVTEPSPTGPSPTGSPSPTPTIPTASGPFTTASSPTGGSVVPSGNSPATTPGNVPSGGAVYTGAASKMSYSLVGVLCIAGAAFLF